MPAQPLHTRTRKHSQQILHRWRHSTLALGLALVQMTFVSIGAARTYSADQISFRCIIECTESI